MAAIAAFAAAFVLTPLEGRPQRASTPADSVPVRRPADRTPIVALEPTADPFAERVSDDDSSDHTPPPPVLPALPHLTALPPNAGAGPFPFGAPPGAMPAVSVRAIALGTHPVALIDDGAGSARIVGAGDLLDGRRIERIESDAIVLAGGTRLLFAPPTLP